MKKIKKGFIFGTPLVVIALVVLALQTGFTHDFVPLTHPKPLKGEALPQVNGQPLHTYNENPTPRFKANAHADKSGFLSRDEVKAKVTIDSSQGEKLTSAILETYADYMKRNNIKDVSAEISPDRMLWVVKINKPHGMDTKGGLFDQADAYYAFDAKTGEELFMRVTGHRQSYNHPQ